MSECVVRMEMPENCQRCELFILCTGKYKNEVVRFDGQNIDKKDRRCLFICSLPEGHGRLVDADAIIEVMKKCAENSENGQALLCYRYVQRILEEALTIVPAERSEE